MRKKRKSKGNRKTTEPTVSGPFAGVFWRLLRDARTNSLFVLPVGDPQMPTFLFHDATRGNVLLSYWPNTRNYSFAGTNRHGGRCERHYDIIDVARTAAGVPNLVRTRLDTPGR